MKLTPRTIRMALGMGWMLALGCGMPLAAAEPAKSYDVVVYGGTSGGVVAAIQAARLGKSVVLIEPGRHLGGLTSGGLGATDIGNKAAIGGISRDFYRRIGAHYAKPDAWRWQKSEQYKSGRQASGEGEMWTFEPHVAETLYDQMVAEAKVPVFRELRLDLKTGVVKEGNRIRAIRFEGGREIAGRMFIDATYEGDLMALAGVSYHVGREGNAKYGETLNGIEVAEAKHHQFKHPVDPYIKPGDPASGLLPGIQGTDPGHDGDGDKRVQAYNFRMCLTDAPENRIPIPQPARYNALRYELLLRYIQTGVWDAFGSNSLMPNRKTDTNNNGAFSTDNIGMNYDYPEGDYDTRARIFTEHVMYQQGLMWFVANDPRVPEKIRHEMSRWGLCKDEFTADGGWPHQMYIREARRMVGAYVMTQHNCQGREKVEDSVGLAAYTMDSHNTQRYARDGKVQNEGDVQVGGFPPYPIAYRSLTPKEAECANLLVPVCLSASHIAYGSIRMEPVFMVLGQSVATAAAQALDADLPVQRIDVKKLQHRLKADGQVLEWTGPALQAGRDPQKLPGTVLDDASAKLIGEWSKSSAIGGFIGAGYIHDANADKGQKSATFEFTLANPGTYEVRVAYTANPNRATNVPIKVTGTDGEKEVRLNERQEPKSDGFTSVGKFDFDKQAKIEISNAGTDGHVIVDAVQLLKVIK
jgi:hypothetical protein